jgi:PAS domain S-box-containing protein
MAISKSKSIPIEEAENPFSSPITKAINQGRKIEWQRWIPALATTGVLLSFIAFVIASQNLSGLVKTMVLLFSLVISGVSGVVIYHLSDLKIAYKGLVLISIPFLFVLLFVAMITRMKTESEEAQKWYLHTKEVIATAESLSRNLTNSQYVLRSYAMTGNSTIAAPYYRIARETPDTIRQLQSMVKDNPQQSARAAYLGDKATERLALLAAIEGSIREGRPGQADEQLRSSQLRDAWGEYSRELEQFIAEENRLDSQRHQRIDQSWLRLSWLLVVGTLAALALTGMLVYLFGQNISNRLSIVNGNAQSLAAGRMLSAPLNGKDEIAVLDRVFHYMAKTVAEANRKERALVENARDVICSLDPDGRFVKINPASLRILGYESEELIGRRLIDLVSPEEAEHIRQMFDSIAEMDSIDSFETCCLHKNGEPVNLLWAASWVPEEHQMFCVGRDITERKQAEEKNKQLNQILEQHALQLQAANKELESFSYSVSHDLRAPLRHIDGFVGLLEKQCSALLSNDGQRYVRVISESAKQMGHLIDDLLAFSRMGRTEMRQTAVDMQRLVEEVRMNLAKEAGERQLVWRIEPLPKVQADPAMLRLALTNLLSNAIKYTRGRQEAVIEIGSQGEASDLTVFFIRDNGVGFDMQYNHKLFGVFQRLHRADEFEGTGIGLANVRRIITRHGGQTWAEGKVDQGATFYFSIPRYPKLTREVHAKSNSGEAAIS